MAEKWTYFFSPGSVEGDEQRRDILGGKGASLAAMCRAGLSVPPGFTISAECCRLFLEAGGEWPDGLVDQVRHAMARLEQVTGRGFGRADRPLLVSVRSGAAVSMPGMMDTILNCGLSPAMAPADRNGTASFWMVYSQFLQAFAKTALGFDSKDFAAIERRVMISMGTGTFFARNTRKEEGLSPLAADGFERLARGYEDLYAAGSGRPFPTDPWDALTACIEMVFRSWNTERAVVFRRERGITGLAGTAVTVQAMFPSQVSGVAFTQNPGDLPANEIIIESSWGLGEAVVSGDVHPDHFVLARDGLSIKRRSLGHKTHVVSALGDTGGRDSDLASLSDADVRRVGELAMKVEGFFSRPMDIEWGLADGELSLLQSRPIASLEQAEEYGELVEATRAGLRQMLDTGGGPWVLHNLAETLPAPTPLTWSVIKPFMSGDGGFGLMYRQAGFLPSPRACREGFLDLIAGRVYMDAARAGEMFFENYPFRYDLNLLRTSPDAAQSPPTVPTGGLRARWRLARRLGKINAALHALADDFDHELTGKVIPDFVKWCGDESRRDLAALGVEELISLWEDRRRRVMDDFAPQSLLPGLISGLALDSLRAFMAEHFWQLNEDTDDLAGTLCAPGRPDMTMQSNAAMYALAGGRLSLDKWIERFGHRAPEEFDLASPRWRERAQDALAMADRLKGGADPMELHRLHMRRTHARLADLRRRLAPRDRREFNRYVRMARRYIIFREDGKHYLMLGYQLLRDVALEAGRRLGIGDDAFMLSQDELFDAIRGGRADGDGVVRGEGILPSSAVGVPPASSTVFSASSSSSLQQQHRQRQGETKMASALTARTGTSLEQRRKTYRAAKRLSMPNVLDKMAVDTLGEPPGESSAGCYKAMPLSVGSATGPVCIVRNPGEGGMMPRGCVLVCTSTDPAWTPLFVNAAALVLECGGTLSHGAVVARELGLPAVVLPGATRLFQQGETIFVDGRGGMVHRSDSAVGMLNNEPSPADVRVRPQDMPPPPSRRERIGGHVRNWSLAAWGVVLAGAFLLAPERLYQPSMDALDAALWPLIAALGKPLGVAAIALIMAALTIVGQRVLCDNARLREARRRGTALARQAARLPADSSRRAALYRASAPVQIRLLAAAMLPLALLLGPMVMTFLWLPARVDPASWNAAAGSSVSVIAMVDCRWDKPVTLSVQAPLTIDTGTAPTRQMQPIIPTLQAKMDQWRTTTQPWTESIGSSDPPGKLLADLADYLKAPPPVAMMWQVRSEDAPGGRFAARVSSPGAAPLEAVITLGESCPSGLPEVTADEDSPIRSIRLVYSPPARQRIFWAPINHRSGEPWDLGWLTTYLLAYLPTMFALRFALRVA